MKILAIETSCDETAVALVRCGQRMDVLHDFVSSQISIQQKYGGVVPEVAARSHVAETVSLITQALADQGLATFDALTVTRGPGLAAALRVGVEAARVLAMVSGKPLIGVNHLEGHLASAWLQADNRRQWQFPLLALVVSGGHTELVLMKDFCAYTIIGQTRDDAAGEAFDKSAKLMGLPYPGGPQIAKLALQGDPASFDLPRPMWHERSYDFSFSGLKTAIRQLWEKMTVAERQRQQANLAAAIQRTIVEVLIKKTMAAAKNYQVKGILLVGGVSANLTLRDRLAQAIKTELPEVAYLPSDRAYVTDNAAMIAAAGYWHLQRGENHSWETMDVDPEWQLENLSYARI